MHTSVAPSAYTRDLVVAAQRGTVTAAPAMNQLIEEHEGLIRSIVSNIRSGELPLDEDLLQVARIAFADAIISYRPGGASLATFAWGVVYRAVLKEVRRQSQYRLRIPQVSINERGHEAASLDDGMGSILEGFALQDALKKLPAADGELLKRLYDNDMTQTAVAKAFGVSHTAIYKRHLRVLKQLRISLTA